MTESINKDAFKAVMGSFAAAVTVVTTQDAQGKRWGMTATAFSSLSLDPPLGLVCIDKRAGCHAAISAAGKFAVSMLTEAQEDLSNRFASRADDKFEGVASRAGDVTGCPLLEGALAWMECELVSVLPGGDHAIFVGRLVGSGTADGKPLLYWRGKYAGLMLD